MTPINEPDALSSDEQVFAREVRRRREDRGWSQAELLRRLHAAGLDYMNQTALSRLENGTRQVRMVEGLALARAFETTVSDLMHPDGRETILKFALDGERAGRRAFVDTKTAARNFAETQLAVASQLAAIEDLYDPDNVDAELKPRLDGYLLNARNFLDIDIIAEVGSIVASVKRRGLG